VRREFSSRGCHSPAPCRILFYRGVVRRRFVTVLRVRCRGSLTAGYLPYAHRCSPLHCASGAISSDTTTARLLLVQDYIAYVGCLCLVAARVPTGFWDRFQPRVCFPACLPVLPTCLYAPASSDVDTVRLRSKLSFPAMLLRVRFATSLSSGSSAQQQ